jgi:hypothetical protein
MAAVSSRKPGAFGAGGGLDAWLLVGGHRPFARKISTSREAVKAGGQFFCDFFVVFLDFFGVFQKLLQNKQLLHPYRSYRYISIVL